MFPIGDTVSKRGRPYIVYGIIALNALVFAWQLTLDEAETIAFLKAYALVPLRYVSPGWAESQGLVWLNPLPFLTSMFLHGGFLHIIFNMWTLWVFGRALEDRLGPRNFVLLYLLSGLAAGLLHMVFNLGSPIPTLGASGAIAGTISAYAVRFPYAWINIVIPIVIIPFFFTIPAMLFAAVWFGLQILQGTSQLFVPNMGAGVAWWAHIGGFVAGWYLVRWLDETRGGVWSRGGAEAGWRGPWG